MTKKTRAKNKAPGIDSAALRESFATAVAWFKPDQWPQLLEVSSDRDNLEDRYEDWLGAEPDLRTRPPVPKPEACQG